jgi:hypothetical protein
VQAFAERCLTCSNTNSPRSAGFQRQSGCAACHAVTNWEDPFRGDRTIPRMKRGTPQRTG